MVNIKTFPQILIKKQHKTLAKIEKLQGFHTLSIFHLNAIFKKASFFTEIEKPKTAFLRLKATLPYGSTT